MAKNIDFMGAIFPDVPSVKLPQQGGGLVSFDDTTDATATASEILSGYTAYANGQKLVGTASGGITPSGTISITQNGQVDVTNYATADVNVSGGGGASNVVQGTFTTSSTTGAASTLTIPYTGNGYPIYFACWIDGGMYNNTESGNTDWYNSLQRYAIGYFSISKGRTTTAPTYMSGGADNYGVVMCIYKNSTSSSTNYSRAFAQEANSFSNVTASSTSTVCVRFMDNGTTVSYYVASTSYGLVANTKYAYIAVYSS